MKFSGSVDKNNQIFEKIRSFSKEELAELADAVEAAKPLEHNKFKVMQWFRKHLLLCLAIAAFPVLYLPIWMRIALIIAAYIAGNVLARFTPDLSRTPRDIVMLYGQMPKETSQQYIRIRLRNTLCFFLWFPTLSIPISGISVLSYFGYLSSYTATTIASILLCLWLMVTSAVGKRIYCPISLENRATRIITERELRGWIWHWIAQGFLILVSMWISVITFRFFFIFELDWAASNTLTPLQNKMEFINSTLAISLFIMTESAISHYSFFKKALTARTLALIAKEKYLSQLTGSQSKFTG